MNTSGMPDLGSRPHAGVAIAVTFSRAASPQRWGTQKRCLSQAQALAISQIDIIIAGWQELRLLWAASDGIDCRWLEMAPAPVGATTWVGKPLTRAAPSRQRQVLPHSFINISSESLRSRLRTSSQPLMAKASIKGRECVSPASVTRPSRLEMGFHQIPLLSQTTPPGWSATSSISSSQRHHTRGLSSKTWNADHFD